MDISKTTRFFAIQGLCLLSCACFIRADDVRLANGRVLRNVTVNGSDADGVVITPQGFAATATKYPWRMIHPEDASRLQAAAEEQAKKEQALAALDKIKIKALVQPRLFFDTYFTATITPIVLKAMAAGLYSESSNEYRDSIREVPDKDASFSGDIEGKLQKNVGSESAIILYLYYIGHSDDTLRKRRFTTDPARAARYLAEEQ